MIPKTTYKNVFEAAREWFIKIDYLKNQISSIEKIEGIPVLTISVFLLKSQLVEFEIKQLLTSLDQHIFFSCDSNTVNIKPRYPSYFDEKNFTLGILIEEMKRYNSPIVKELVEDLLLLNHFRKQFTHKLFNADTTLDKINLESKKGVIVANNTLKKITEFEKLLEEKDPLRKTEKTNS